MNSEYKGKEYATKDISSIVGIATPTVRKYAQALEKAGYSFIKNGNGFRIFTDKDIYVFNEIKSQSKKHAIPVDRIAEMIVFNHNKQKRYESTSHPLSIEQAECAISNDIVRYDTRYTELLEKLSKVDMIDDIMKEIEELKKVNKLLVIELQKQQDFIRNIQNERDKQLINSMKLTMENKHIKCQLEEIKTTLLEAAAGQQKKGLFGNLLSKK
jgi:DNA-binding transcriptional MerR regulator